MIHSMWRAILGIAALSCVIGLSAGLVRKEAVGGEFRAGAAVTDITPGVGVSLNGPISKPGPVKGVHDPLHARAIVLDDGAARCALVVLDLTMIERAVCDKICRRVEAVTRIPGEHVLVSATHTHAAPRVRAGRAGPLDDRYYDLLIQRAAEAVQQAEQNLQPAEMGFGSFEAPEYVKCRRFLCEPGTVGPNPFGEVGERVRSVSGKGGKVLRPAGPVDPEFSILALRHQDGTPLAVLGNFSVHYCGGYARGQVSADYFGYFCRRLEQVLAANPSHPPCVALMSNGTSGDTSSISTGGKKYRPFEWMRLSGEELAERAAQTIRRMSFRRDVSLGLAARDLPLKIRKPDERRLDWARRVLATESTQSPHPWTRIYAQQALLLSRYPAKRPVRIQAIRVGDVAIAGVACEVFAETGLAIKRNSPFKKTFTISLANGADGYLPTPQQHAWGGYETWPATSSCLEVNAEPAIRKGVLELLRTVNEMTADNAR